MAFHQGDRTPERREGRSVLTTRPTLDEIALLGRIELYFDSETASEAQRWGLALLRAAKPKIDAQERRENRLAQFGGRRDRGRW